MNQLYTISNFFLTLALITLLNINWPENWFLLFQWLKVFILPVQVLVPFDLLLNDPEVGLFVTFLVTLMLHPVSTRVLASNRIRHRSTFSV